jgi:anti-sigma B factor antagonist
VFWVISSPCLQIRGSGQWARFRVPSGEGVHAFGKGCLATSGEGTDSVNDESFGVGVVNHNGRAIVFISGEIDMSSSPAVCDALSTAQQGSTDVIVDLSKVTFIDSTGINSLIRAFRRAPDDGSLQVVGAKSIVRRVFQITGVSELLLLEPPRLTWRQVTYNNSGWRQWMTEEQSDNRGPLAEIIEVGPSSNWGSNNVQYALDSDGETTLYNSLEEAMQAAELRRSLTRPTPTTTGDDQASRPPRTEVGPAD